MSSCFFLELHPEELAKEFAARRLSSSRDLRSYTRGSGRMVADSETIANLQSVVASHIPD
jgi:hypothetical protein